MKERKARPLGRTGRVLFGLAVLTVAWLVWGPDADHARVALPQRSVPLALAAAPAAPPGGWTSVAKAAMPAVVNVASTKTVAGRQGPAAPFADPFFGFFPAPDASPRREHSLGSGVIVTADGYVLTNNHVVGGAQDVRVSLDDRRQFSARLVGADPKTDIAVLKLEGTGLPVLPLGDSNRVEVAESVLAIGNPFGLSQTVTQGIVSAVGRANVGIAAYEDFIQTDAAINPGNSGGALVNAAGGLIGINTAMVSQTGGNAGIGFAVPVNMARQVMDQLVQHGKVTRGYLGVLVQELTPALARGLGLADTRGVLVGSVEPDGPAVRAGLLRGDVITAIDGKPVVDAGHFRNVVAATAPGSKARLGVLRDGKERLLDVAVGELPAEPAPASQPAPATPDRLGLSLQEVTPEAARTLGLAPGTVGAVVANVVPGGPGAAAGLRPGDVVQEVNRQPVRSVGDLKRVIEQSAGADLVLLVNRRGSTAYVMVERGGAPKAG